MMMKARKKLQEVCLVKCTQRNKNGKNKSVKNKKQHKVYKENENNLK